jgi:hypothetical protein
MRAVREQERLFSEMSRRAADAGLADERNDVCVPCPALPYAALRGQHGRAPLPVAPALFFSCRVPPGAMARFGRSILVTVDSPRLAKPKPSNAAKANGGENPALSVGNSVNLITSSHSWGGTARLIRVIFVTARLIRRPRL